MFNEIDDEIQELSMDKFYPALVQCFGIIICGYVAGRFRIITSAETKGLNTYVGTFALPSLIFLSLVELNWKIVNWAFLISILISKAIVFFAVMSITLLASRPLNYGRAGLLSIFCTQSNDFAIGFPIVNALYKNSHPEYAAYLYILAPISLAVLNPIGLILVEFEKLREKREDNDLPICSDLQHGTRSNLRDKLLVLLKILASIFFNPILVMTILGIASGLIFSNGLPEIISSVFNVLGKSFSATALFLLGLRIVGKNNQFKGASFLMSGILIIVKLLVLPLVIRQTVYIMQAGGNFTETTELSSFGFLYGTFPAAPGVFVIAGQYNIDVDLVANSMVASTFISGPLMFISAKMISLANLDPADYIHELDRFSFDISVTGILACFWVLLLFGATKRIWSMPHRITSFLVLSQLFCCVGVILWSRLENANKWINFFQFFLFTVGTYSSRLWTAILAITLLFLQCRSLCFVIKLWPYMVSVSLGLPSFLSFVLILVDGDNLPIEKRNPNYQYGNVQAAVTVFLLVMCFIVTVGCLVLHQRYKTRFEKYLTLSREISNPTADPTFSNDSVTTVESNENDSPILLQTNCSGEDEDQFNSRQINNCCHQTHSSYNVVDIEDFGELCNERDEMRKFNSSRQRTKKNECCQIQKDIRPANNDIERLEYSNHSDEHQAMKHTVLLIFLLCSMFVGLAISIWTLIMEGMSGIYIELSFLDAFLNFGQSLIVLAIFVTDTGELWQPITIFWRKVWYGSNAQMLPVWSELSAETKHICEQFRTYHLETCKSIIGTDKRWRIRIYKEVFYGSDLTNWLVEVGLAKDRLEATSYATHLMNGRVIRHINNDYNFDDTESLYFFCSKI